METSTLYVPRSVEMTPETIYYMFWDRAVYQAILLNCDGHLCMHLQEVSKNCLKNFKGQKAIDLWNCFSGLGANPINKGQFDILKQVYSESWDAAFK